MLTLSSIMSAGVGVNKWTVARRNFKVVSSPLFEYEVSAPQHDFLTDDSTRHLAFIGGLGAGKTFSLTRWVGQKQYAERGTGTVGALLANTYEQINQATLPLLWEFYDQLGMEYGKDYVFNEVPPKFWRGFHSRFKKRHHNIISVRRWGQIIVRSLQNYQHIRGVELGWAAIDEARGAKHEAFLVILGRLRCKRARKIQLRLVTTPNGYDWIHDEFEEKLPKLPAGMRRMISAASSSNFTLSQEYLDTLAASYDPRMAEQEIGGKFVLLNKGLVYYQFDRNVHMRDVQIDPKSPVQVCFDFNRNPFSVVIAQVVTLPNGMPMIHVLDEISIQDAGTEEACRQVARHLSAIHKAEPTEVQVYGDASGRARDTRSNVSDYDIITREFTELYKNRFVRRWRMANPPVQARYNAVNAMLRNALGQVRMLVHPRCEKLRRDFERVIYKPGSSEADKVTDKTLTHLSDGLGYMVEDRFPIRMSSGGRVAV